MWSYRFVEFRNLSTIQEVYWPEVEAGVEVGMGYCRPFPLSKREKRGAIKCACSAPDFVRASDYQLMNKR